MHFEETRLEGAYIVDLDKREDPRGFFARAFCQQEFGEHDLETRFVQGNVSYNRSAGTLRGLHYQAAPHEEVKLIRCISGAIYDVIVDLRPRSPTVGQWIGVELSAQNRRALYVPRGFAHGFETLLEDAEVFYLVSEFYTPGAERGLRYDDPALGITWPLPISVISDKDAAWPRFAPDPGTHAAR